MSGENVERYRVRRLSVDRIVPYPGNPRVNDAAVDAVVASIKEFGFRQPIVIDQAGVIICGHTRYKAALKLGYEKVPVHIATELTPEQVRAYRLADNKTSDKSDWDYDLLPLEINKLQAANYDLGVLGFDEKELDRLLAPLGTELIEPDEIPEAPSDPVTKPGDIWHLGRHRLMCGDATKREDVAKLLDGDKFDLLLTDPPYGVKYVGKTADALTIENDNLDEPALRQFLVSAFRAASEHQAPGGSFYIWHADSFGHTFRAACAEAGLRVRQCLVWVKSCFSLGRQDYQWKHEPCLYGWAEGASHTWLSDRCQTTVLEFDKPSRNADHPTMKPVDLFAYLIGNSSHPADRVFDPFAGSGTTLLACEQIGRTARVMELDPRYCDVIVRRFQKAVGHIVGVFRFPAQPEVTNFLAVSTVQEPSPEDSDSSYAVWDDSAPEVADQPLDSESLATAPDTLPLAEELEPQGADTSPLAAELEPQGADTSPLEAAAGTPTPDSPAETPETT